MTCDICGAVIPDGDESARTHWRAEMYSAPVMFHPLSWMFCIPCGFTVADAINGMRHAQPPAASVGESGS